MGWFYFKCPSHGQFRLTLERRQAAAQCPKCFSMGSAMLGVPGATVMESLDNGAMARRVVRMHDIEEVLDAASDQHGAQQEVPEEDPDG